jgi:dihydroflavonol-4-reductase
VLGASSRRGTIGGELFRNILAGEFSGAAYPVNRGGEPVAGVRAFTSIAEIPDPVDLAVICVPGAQVLDAAQAALEQGVRKMVHVSSSGTIAVSREPVVHDEKSGYKHELVGEWPYYLSKVFAEKLALSCFEQHKLPVVVVNPSLLLGPGDDRGSSTRDVALFLEGRIQALPLGGLNFVDVRDAAAGLIAAMRSGKAGERYLLGGPNWSFRDFVQNLARVSGVRAPRMQPSLKFSLASARVLRRLLPLVGKSFALDDASIKMSALFWYCDSTKARSELGFKTRDPIETLRDTVEDLRRRK